MKKSLLFVFAVLLVLIIPSLTKAAAHTEGTVIISGGTVYKVENNQRRGFPSAEIFFSHGYKFSDVVTANSDDLALSQGANMDFADGTLVNDNGTIFMVNQGAKRGFTTASVFTGLGFKFSNVFKGSTPGFVAGVPVSSIAASHPEGSLVSNSGTIWWVRVGGRSGIPSFQVFNSYGFIFGRVVPANAVDMSLPVLPNTIERQNGDTTGAVINCEAGSFNEQFLCLINAYRTNNGRTALSYDPTLNVVAAGHSAWMNQNSTLSHTGSGGSTFWERCVAAGTTCDAENIAQGYTTAQTLFNAWRNSAGHNANMLGNHSVTGLGLDGAYTTSLFR